MTAANDPAGSMNPVEDRPLDTSSITSSASTPIQAAPPPPMPLAGVQTSAPPRPLREPLTPERLGAEITRLDRALVVVLLVLAFFLASFAAHNTTFWMHLATG